MSKQMLSYREELKRMKMRRVAEMRKLRKTKTLDEIARIYGFKNRQSVSYYLGKTGRLNKSRKVSQ